MRILYYAHISLGKQKLISGKGSEDYRGLTRTADKLSYVSNGVRLKKE